jgi:transposase
METSLARDLMSDEEWTFHERFILAVRALTGRKPLNHRLVLDGIFWIARTGSPWRDLPEGSGKWSSVYCQFRHWTLAGLWEQIMDALDESGLVPDALQMVDSTVVRAIIRQRALKGDSTTGFRPFARWLHDQDPPPRQWRRPAHEVGHHAGADIGPSGLRSGHG